MDPGRCFAISEGDMQSTSKQEFPIFADRTSIARLADRRRLARDPAQSYIVRDGQANDVHMKDSRTESTLREESPSTRYLLTPVGSLTI